MSALGYFVDLFDFVLFGVYRIQSLTDIGVPGEAQLKMGMSLLSTQMGGMIVGGIVWGFIADKRGRTSVLLASILTYSIANIANGFITGIDQYFICRFFAGFGLAGEIGAAVTLISEVISKERRELGTAFLFGIGFVGAIVGCLTALVLQWRTAYFVGGGMGIALLLMRATLTESGLFKGLAAKAMSAVADSTSSLAAPPPSASGQACSSACQPTSGRSFQRTFPSTPKSSAPSARSPAAKASCTATSALPSARLGARSSAASCAAVSAPILLCLCGHVVFSVVILSLHGLPVSVLAALPRLRRHLQWLLGALHHQRCRGLWHKHARLQRPP